MRPRGVQQGHTSRTKASAAACPTSGPEACTCKVTYRRAHPIWHASNSNFCRGKSRASSGYNLRDPICQCWNRSAQFCFEKPWRILRVLDRLGTRTRTHISARSDLRAGRNPKVNEETAMTIASDLLHQHIQTLVADNAHWQTLIADDLVWELPYAPTIGHPARLSGREEVMGYVTWFLGAVDNFRFFDLTGVCLRRSGRGCRRSQGGGADQADRASLSPGVCGVPACGRRQDRVPPRIFRSRACSQGAGHANSWSRILRTRGNGSLTRAVTLFPGMFQAVIRRRAALTNALASLTVHSCVGRNRYLIALISVAFLTQLSSRKRASMRDKMRRARSYLSSASTRKYSSSTA